MPKVSGTIESAFLFRVSLLSSMFLITGYCVIIQLLVLWAWLPCACSSPWWVKAGLTVGEGAGGQLLLLPEGCGLALPSSFHYLCAQHSDLLTLFSVESGSVPSQGLWPCSLCLEYFVLDSLWPGFTWFPTILAPAQNLLELIIPMGTSYSYGLEKTLYFCFLIYLSLYSNEEFVMVWVSVSSFRL